MSELRRNPLNGRWVTVASDRAARPAAFVTRRLPVEGDPSRPCPFCPGHEEKTAPALETYGPGGAWLVRVVPNLYPAFEGAEPMAVTQLGRVHRRAPASGIHEVLVLSPGHDDSWADLEPKQSGLVMAAIRDRVEEHSRSRALRYSQVLVNHGRESGASIAHPHGQLLALPFVPGEVADEVEGFSTFTPGCLLCETVAVEVREGQRVVFDNELVTVIAPYWSGTPYEMLVIPRVCEPDLHGAHPTDLVAVGKALIESLRMLRNHLGDVAYNLVFHAAPYGQGKFHWHVHVLPNVTTRAGFELGTGVMINIVPPELAAGRLTGQSAG